MRDFILNNNYEPDQKNRIVSIGIPVKMLRNNEPDIRLMFEAYAVKALDIKDKNYYFRKNTKTLILDLCKLDKYLKEDLQEQKFIIDDEMNFQIGNIVTLDKNTKANALLLYINSPYTTNYNVLSFLYFDKEEHLRIYIPKKGNTIYPTTVNRKQCYTIIGKDYKRDIMHLAKEYPDNLRLAYIIDSNFKINSDKIRETQQQAGQIKINICIEEFQKVVDNSLDGFDSPEFKQYLEYANERMMHR